MTPLTKPVRRRAQIAYRGRRVVCSLVPGDLIELRLERTRQREYIPINAVYQLAVMIRVKDEKAAKAAIKAAKKKERRR